MSEAYRDVLKTYIEGPNGYDASCDKKLVEKTNLTPIETVQKLASDDLKDDLNISAAKMLEQGTEILNTRLGFGTFPATLIIEFTSKLRRRIDGNKKRILSAWKQHVASKQSKVRMDNVEKTLAQKMDSRIDTRQELMERIELEKLFDASWKECIKETEQSLHASMLTYQDIATRVTEWIHLKVTAHPGENIYVTLTPLATKTSERKDLILELPAESFQKYVKLKYDGHYLQNQWISFWNPQLFAKMNKWGITHIHMIVHHHFRALDKHYSSSLHWKPDGAYCAQQVAEAVGMVESVQKKLKSCKDDRIIVELEVKQFANDVLDCLRQWIIDHWIQKQEEDKNKQLEDLKSKESRIKTKLCEQTCWPRRKPVKLH